LELDNLQTEAHRREVSQDRKTTIRVPGASMDLDMIPRTMPELVKGRALKWFMKQETTHVTDPQEEGVVGTDTGFEDVKTNVCYSAAYAAK